MNLKQKENLNKPNLNDNKNNLNFQKVKKEKVIILKK